MRITGSWRRPALAVLGVWLAAGQGACIEWEFPADCPVEDFQCPPGFKCNLGLCTPPYSLGDGELCDGDVFCAPPLRCTYEAGRVVTPSQFSSDEVPFPSWPEFCRPSGEEGDYCTTMSSSEFECEDGLGCVSFGLDDPYRCLLPGPSGAFCEPNCVYECFGWDCYPPGADHYE